MTKKTESNGNNKPDFDKGVQKTFLGLAISPFVLYGLGLLAIPIGLGSEGMLVFCVFWGISVGCFASLALMCYSLYFQCNEYVTAGFFLCGLNIGVAYWVFMFLAGSNV